MGEIQVRGPWITAGYHGVDTPEKFDAGTGGPRGRTPWLRTGDVGVIEPNGFVQLVDRTKDVIKSGGEWISSVDLENALMGHPDVVECAVIGVADERWDERPLACVVRRDGQRGSPDDAERLPRRQGRQLVAARAVRLRRRGPEDVGRQVRQEGAARRPRAR